MAFFYLIVFFASLTITLLLIPRVLFLSLQKRLIDAPDSRKRHKEISSRLGGLTFYPGIMLPICILVCIDCYFTTSLWYLVVTPWFLACQAACFVMYILGISDDIRPIGYRYKFIFQIFAAGLIIISGAWINNLHGFLGIYAIPNAVGIPLTMLFVVLVINAMNLIDGIDGLASGLGIMTAVVFAFIFNGLGLISPAIICVAMAGSLLGFFRYNVFGLRRKRVRIFMGDSGSLLMGVLMAALAAKLINYRLFSDPGISRLNAVVAISMLMLPCFDVARVMIQRVAVSRSPFSPDRNHIHHKIMDLGYSPRCTLFMLLGAEVVIVMINLVLLQSTDSVTVVAFSDLALWIATSIYIDTRLVKRAENKK